MMISSSCRLAVLCLFLLACRSGIRNAVADERQPVPPLLSVTKQAGDFRFLLTGTDQNAPGLWVIQSSFNMDAWEDLAVMEDRNAAGVLMMDMPAESLLIEGRSGRFFRARSFDGDAQALRFYLEARTKWQASGVDSYSMDVNWQVSWFFWDGNIVVRNNQVISAVARNSNFFEPPEPKTIDDWFAVLKHAIDRNAERIDVTYNKIYGFPQSVYIDMSRMIADEEQGWTITNFIPHR